MIDQQADKIDYNAMASAIAQTTSQSTIKALADAGLLNKPEQKSTRSEFEETLQAVMTNPNSDAQTAATIGDLFLKFEKKIKSEMTAEQQREVGKALIQERNRSTISIIESAMDGYIEKDSRADRYRTQIKNKIIETFTKEPKYKEAREAYDRGEVDIKLFKDLALAEVRAFGDEKAPARAASGVSMNDSNAETQSVVSAPEKDTQGNTTNKSEIVKGLTEKERAAYYARLGTMQRIGVDRDSEKAHQSGMRAVQNIRNGNARFRNGERPGFYSIGKR